MSTLRARAFAFVANTGVALATKASMFDIAHDGSTSGGGSSVAMLGTPRSEGIATRDARGSFRRLRLHGILALDAGGGAKHIYRDKLV